MRNLNITFITELMKLRRSKLFWITIAFFMFIPLMMGLLMLVAQNPEIIKKLGIVGTKATLFSQNNWKGFLDMLNQLVAVIGLIGFGFVTAWVFGREYIEHTIINILALPVTRTSIVISKFLLIFIWCLLLSIVLYITGIIIGHIIGIQSWSTEILSEFTKKYFSVALMTILLSTPIAIVTCYSRGIIAPLGFVILLVIMSQFVSVAGLGPYFPWAIPGVSTVVEGTQGMELVPGSYIIVLITSILGVFGTIAWWRKADQH